MSAAAAISIKEGGQGPPDQFGPPPGPPENDAIAIAMELMQGTCADLLEAAQEHIGLPPPNEDELRAMLEGFKDAGEIVGEPDLIWHAMVLKHSMCELAIEHVTPAVMENMSCEEFIEAGKYMGWINPNPGDFKELFDVPEDVWVAGGNTFERCEEQIAPIIGEDYESTDPLE